MTASTEVAEAVSDQEAEAESFTATASADTTATATTAGRRQNTVYFSLQQQTDYQCIYFTVCYHCMYLHKRKNNCSLKNKTNVEGPNKKADTNTITNLMALCINFL